VSVTGPARGLSTAGAQFADVLPDPPDQLLVWLENPATTKGAHFARAGDDWEFWSYERLAELAHRVAGQLVEDGVGHNEVVTIVQRSSPAFIASLFGTMLAGAVPSPVAPPMAFQDKSAYREHVQALLGAARPSVVLADADLVNRLQTYADHTGVQVKAIEAILAPETRYRGRGVDRPLADFALLQFTSGSSGHARGVCVPHHALISNVEAIRRWLRWTADDPVASWLPVHHDMGLVGCLITPVISQSDVWLLQPEQFVHHPVRYLRCFGQAGARLTATPNFGLDYIVRRVGPEVLDDMDFSEWRAIIVGAEHLDARSFEQFHELLAPFGLDRRALLPAYGLAEATLAVTGVPLPEEWTRVIVDASSLSFGRPLVRRDRPDRAGIVAVGCGRPLAGLTVAIADEADEVLGEAQVGEIIVRGSSIAAGYVAETQGTSTRFVDGVLHTGDAGFLIDGQLFVLGRLGDSLKIRGRSLFAEDLETELRGLGAPRHRVAVVLGAHRGEPTVVVVFERADPVWLTQAADLLARRAEGATIVVFDAPGGTIRRTSSGKIQRRRLWHAFTDGTLATIAHTG
jgi:acyl-CoA synthetase (AMP-forming)/AMP-acid ligase II